MNHLKYVLGIQVPRRIPSNASLSKTHTKGAFRKCQTEIHVSESTLLLTSQPKKLNQFRSSHFTTPIKNSLDLEQQELIRKHRICTHQFKRQHNGKRCYVRNNKKLGDSAEGTKNAKQLSNDNATKKEPRSYAQMIESYSGMICNPNAIVALKDNLSSPMDNAIKRNPFSTASAVSLKWKDRPKGRKSTNICSVELKTFNQDVKFSSEASKTHCCFRHDNKSSYNTVEENALEKSCTSYAKIIENYNNSMMIDGCNKTGNLISRRNVSTKLNKVHSTALDTKSVCVKSAPPYTTINKSAKSLDTKKQKLEEKGREGWTTKVDDIIQDLKRVSTKTDSTEPKSKEKWGQQSANEPAYWLDRVVNAHKTRITSKEIIPRNASVNAKPVENSQAQKVDTQDDVPKLSRIEEHIQQSPTVASSKKPTNPIVDYIRRGPLRPSTPSQPSSQSPTDTATSSRKQPQIELRMTPSQNESVVSINVDEVATRTAGSANRDQLSVVISSRKNSGPAEASDVRPQTDFGSMHVSISENTVPVKQIEFSINGKPVSELRSIVARADKLDVVSSMDKVEIRIPSKAEATMANDQSRTIPNAASNSPPVLNLQIAAKFNEPRFQQPRGAETKTDPPQMTPTPSPTAPTPRSPPTLPNPHTPHLPPKPSRPQNLFDSTASDSSSQAPTPTLSQSPPATPLSPQTDVSPRNEATKVVKEVNISNMTNAKGSENVNRTEDGETFLVGNPQAPVNKGNTLHLSKMNFSNENGNDALRRSNTTTNSPAQSPSVKINETRTPSKIIPWWSSEDSFKKIRKKDTRGTSTPFETILSPKIEENVNRTRGKQQPDQILKREKGSIDIKHFDTYKKNTTTVKPQLDDKLTTISKSANDSVRTRSPQKWITVKPKAGATVTKVPRSTNISNNTSIKKGEYRIRNNVPSEVPLRKDSSAVSSTVRSPEVVKHKNLGEPVKKSADASANLTSPVPKVNFGKEKNYSKTEVNVSKKSVDEDPRIKEILKSMQPIEKRKDGTLIDYGVIVPSRNSLGKIRQIPRIPSKSLPNATSKKSTTQQEKTIEPVKTSSIKKQALPDGKNVSGQKKVLEPKNIPSKNKAAEAPDSKIKFETKVTALKTPPKKTASENEKQPPVTTLKKDNLDIRNVSETATKKPPVLSVAEKKKEKPGTAGLKKDLSVRKVALNDPNVKQSASFPKASESLSQPTSEMTEKGSLKETFRKPDTSSVKTDDVTSKSILIDKTKVARPKSYVAANSLKNNALNSREQEKVPFEGTIPAPSNKTVSSLRDSTYSASQKSKTKDIGNIKSPEDKSNVTGRAPFEGTINNQSLNKEKNISSTNKGKIELDKEKKDISASKSPKVSINSVGSKSGPTNTSGSTTLKSKPGDADTCVVCSREALIEINQGERRNNLDVKYERESKETYVLFRFGTERPEKNLLYSSWLQRFEDRIDDDKVI